MCNVLVESDAGWHIQSTHFDVLDAIKKPAEAGLVTPGEC